MAIQACPKCGARNRVNEFLATAHLPVCGKCGTPLNGSGSGQDAKPQVVTDSNFPTEVMEASSAQPVLVDAWAEWCGPCRALAPVIDQLAAESNGKYKIAKLNVDDNPRTAAQFNIRSIPTLLIFKNGQLVDQLIGAQPQQVITARLIKHS